MEMVLSDNGEIYTISVKLFIYQDHGYMLVPHNLTCKRFDYFNII